MELIGIVKGVGQGWMVGATLLLAGLVFSAPVQGAVPPGFWTKCPTGSGGGDCEIPRGIAVADEVGPRAGHVYVSDQQNNRIDEFTAWGEFVRSWGWDVVATGPDDDTTAPEDQFEICTPANGDACKAGVGGGGRGQMVEPQGLTLDTSGDLYVFSNGRVQKFNLSFGPGEEVQFVWMTGGKVNKTKEEEGAPAFDQNLCPIAPTDVCQAAIAGNGPSEFGGFIVGSYLAFNPIGGTIDVGDQERIQVFEPDGTHVKDISVPGERVQSLAIDSAGNYYVSYLNVGKTNIALSKPNVHKLSSSGASICTIEAKNPTAIAADPAGNIYLVDEAIFGEGRPTEIRQFDSSCADKHESFGEGEISKSTGIATGAGCNNGISVYVSNAVQVDSFVKAYGARPDPVVCEPPVKPPDIDTQYAVSVNTDSAVLRAQINPHFWPDTTYYVEYGTAKCTESTCAQKPLAPGATLKGAGDTDEDVTTTGIVLSELQPNTTYHFRFVSRSSGGGPTVGEEGTFTTFPLPAAAKVNCPNQAFRVGASGHLPDCRAHEMVSPVDKNNGNIVVSHRLTAPRYPSSLEQSSSDGEKVTYSSLTAFGDAVSSPWTSQYIASRKAGEGWSTHAISPPEESKGFNLALKTDAEYNFFSADLCDGWLTHNTNPPLATGAVEGFVNLYRRDDCGAASASYEALTTAEPPVQSSGNYVPELQGVSIDGTHAVFRADDKLTEDAASISTGQLYASKGGELHYVCVLPDGSSSGQTCTAGTLNFLTQRYENTVARALSEDGSRVFWMLPADTVNGKGPGKLYLRLNPDQEPTASGECEEAEADKACTVVVSSSAATRFWTAATDGAKAIYTIGGQLFEYDVEAAESRPIAEGVLGVAEASEDASRIYFASTEVLDEGANSEGDEAKEGQRNLYLYQAGGEGEEGTFTFIGALAGGDVANSPLATITPDPMRRAVRVSPDGRYLAFTSPARLSDYDNTDAESGKADAEVYLFDAQLEKLACVSCNPTGARPEGREVEIDLEPTGFWAAAQIPTWENQLYAPRALSDDGSRLFFESFEALVPRDTNGAQDVYEWERAASKEECLTEKGAELFVASSGGCISLISSGESPDDSEFADASPSGRDVFFRTASSLLPQDPGLFDLYDAREGGGLPLPPPEEPPCEGEACQSPPAPPNDPTPSSNSFEGAGNLPPESTRKTCPKGKRSVRRNGKVRCVAKHKKRTHKRSNRPNHGRAAR